MLCSDKTTKDKWIPEVQAMTNHSYYSQSPVLLVQVVIELCDYVMDLWWLSSSHRPTDCNDNREYHGGGFSWIVLLPTHVLRGSYPKVFLWVLAKCLHAHSKSEIQRKNSDAFKAWLKETPTPHQPVGTWLDDTPTGKVNMHSNRNLLPRSVFWCSVSQVRQ